MTLNNMLETIQSGFRKAWTLLLAVSLVCMTSKMAQADAQANTLSGFNATGDAVQSNRDGLG